MRGHILVLGQPIIETITSLSRRSVLQFVDYLRQRESVLAAESLLVQFHLKRSQTLNILGNL